MPRQAARRGMSAQDARARRHRRDARAACLGGRGLPLFSELLRRDAKLEACLVNDASHITKGASGAHVEKIQSALLIIDDAQIDKSELKSKTYGATTAQEIGRAHV